MSDANKNIVESYYRQLYSPDCARAISNYLAPVHVEHQYTAGFTRQGLRSYVEARLKAHPLHRIIVHQVLGDGNFIFLMAEEKLGDNVDVARGELFRLVNGKIVEHWGAHVIDDRNRKNPHGTFDGARVNRQVDYARQFAKRFEELDLQGFNQQLLESFNESRVPDYKQHSPKGADGREGLVNILAQLKANGQKTSMSPKRVLCDGDFLVSHRLYDSDPPHPLMKRINTFDVFRLNAEGKALEHWDVMESVPSRELLARMF